MHKLNRIVIVGGGAGGLELATRLGETLGKQALAQIILVDHNLTYIWKPLWHEIAAGTLKAGEEMIDYINHGHKHYFKFHLGSITGIDQVKKTILLADVKDEYGQEILPQRELDYDFLILAIGSVHNDFNIPGVQEHAFSFDDYRECEGFQQSFMRKLIRLQEEIDRELNITIIGGGATGIELAAELQYAYAQALSYSNKKVRKKSKVIINILESSPQILPGLARTVANKVMRVLKNMGIRIFTGEKVIRVEKNSVQTANGLKLTSDIILWTAGIKAPDLLTKFGLEVNGKNQLVVKQTLETTYANNIFALGDCASCPQPNSSQPVPPKAQVAHQQAMLLAKSLTLHISHNRPLLPYYFTDYGNLISLGRKKTVGDINVKPAGKIYLEGFIARFTYRFLYRRYQAALHGWWPTLLLVIGESLTRVIRPRLKLH